MTGGPSGTGARPGATAPRAPSGAPRAPRLAGIARSRSARLPAARAGRSPLPRPCAGAYLHQMGDLFSDAALARATVVAARGYQGYLRREELLALQKEPEEQSHPDELLFQTVHQSSE